MSVSQHLRPLVLGLLFAAGFGPALPQLRAQQSAPAISKETIAKLDQAMEATGKGTSEARQRIDLRRVIRDAGELVETHKNDPGRFLVLEFLFRAHQRLIVLDDDAEHRKALLEICRELVNAPDDLAELRIEADLLLNQAEIAKQGANAEDRSKALRPLVDRYVDTPAGAKVLRMAMLIALELGQPDYPRMLNSSLSRAWTDERYTAQITSLMAGDFLVLDPEGSIDPARPPEHKALAKGGAQPLPRGADSMP